MYRYREPAICRHIKANPGKLGPPFCNHYSYNLIFVKYLSVLGFAAKRLEKAPSRRESLWCSEGFVNKTDDYSDDSPLDKVSRSLSQSEFQPEVEIHVVVQHIANRENAEENA